VIKYLLCEDKHVSNGRVCFAGWLSLFHELFIDVVHDQDDSSKVGGSMQEEFCPILENLNKRQA